MTLDELATLIHKVRGEATVEITSINTPQHSQGVPYGIVTIGGTYKRIFHDEEELRKILERRSK